MPRPLHLLALLLLMQRASAAEPDVGPFEGCKVTAAGPPTVHLACDQDVLDVTDALAGEWGDALNEGVLVGIKGGAKQPVEQVEFSMELDGKKHRAVRIISAGTLQWVFMSLARPEGQRTLLCREAVRQESKCHPWIEAAAQWKWRSGPPASVPRDLRTPEVAGRPYQVPQGCGFVDSPGGWTVTCSDKSVLAWMEAPATSALSPEPIIANFRKMMKREGTVACTVEGVSGKCWNGAAPGGDVSVHVSDAAVVRGKRLLVVCLRASAGAGLPPACQSILSVPAP